VLSGVETCEIFAIVGAGPALVEYILLSTNSIPPKKTAINKVCISYATDKLLVSYPGGSLDLRLLLSVEGSREAEGMGEKETLRPYILYSIQFRDLLLTVAMEPRAAAAPTESGFTDGN